MERAGIILLAAILWFFVMLMCPACTTTKNTSKTTTKETTTDDIAIVTNYTTTEIAQGTITTVADTVTAFRSMADLFDGDSLVKETPTMELITKLDRKGNITTRAIAKSQTLHYNVNKVTVSQEAKKEHKRTEKATTVKQKDVQRETGFKTGNLWLIFGVLALVTCFYFLVVFKRNKKSPE